MLTTVSRFMQKAKTALWYRLFFKKIGRRSRIIRPLKLTNPQNIELGYNVTVHDFTWLLTLKTGNEDPKMIIDDGAVIGHFNHITCVNRVYIGKKVLTADKVYISDNIHSYDNPNIAILEQPVIAKGEVSIGENSWIGENVAIIGSKIGKNCVIGANSVVTGDIPDYSVGVGIPCRVIKRYNPQTGNWQKTDAKGEFING